MKPSELLQELETVAQKLGINIRYETGDFKSGLCKVHEEQILIVQKKLPDELKTEIIARDLSTLDLGDVYILPKIRDYLAHIGENSKTTQDDYSDNQV